MKTFLLVAAFASALPVFGVQTASAAAPAYCDGYARNYANQKAGANAVGAGVFGAIAGAAVGGIIGGGKGAGAGALVGGVGGAAVGGSTWQKYYRSAYYKCLNSGPGYAAQPVYVQPQPAYVLPPIGSPAWNYQCKQKYPVSFTATGPGTPGYYTGYDGLQHTCSLP